MDPNAIRRIDNARDVLVGKIPDPKAQVEQITNALIYKFMDDMDKEAQGLGGKPSFFTNGYEKYAWSHILDPRLGGQERLNRYAEALATMSQNPHLPPLFRTIFKDAFLPYRDPETLNLFLKEIDGFTYDHSENLGDAYEYLLSILGSQGDAGQFRTPRHIIDFMVRVIDPRKNETILDPACGTAGFLISSYRHILEQNRDHQLTPDEKERLAGNLQGYDISPDMVRISLVNMYLHSFPNPHIYEYDTLTSEDRWDDQFDICMANPPFMSPKGGIRPHMKFRLHEAKRSEVLFVDYIAEHLKTNGRAAVIVPEGIIFQSANVYKKLRKWLLDSNYLWAVVSLPAGVFQPYSGVKTSILFLDRVFAKKTDEILFAKVQNDGFDLGAQRHPIDKNDLPEVQGILQAWHSGTKQESPSVSWVSKKKIGKSGDYNLTGELYREVAAVNSKYPLAKLGEICKLVSGGTPSKSNNEYWQNGTIKWISAKHIGPESTIVASEFITQDALRDSSTTIIPKGNIILVTRVSVGKIAMADDDYAINQDLTGIIPDQSKVDSRLLFYLLGSRSSWLADNAQGLGVRGITRAFLANMLIPLPPLDIQQQIVAELDGYQRIIDGAKQVIANWKPVIPVDPSWPMVHLGDERFFRIEAGGTPNSSNPDYWNGDIKWATLADLPVDNFITEVTDTVRKITALGLRKSSAKLLPANTVLVSSRATIGRIGVAITPLATNQGFKNVIIKNPAKTNERYIALALTHLVDHMNALASGGTFKEISKTNFATLRIPLAPLDVQREIVASIEKEQQSVESCKSLVSTYEAKISAKIAELWGELPVST